MEHYEVEDAVRAVGIVWVEVQLELLAAGEEWKWVARVDLAGVLTSDVLHEFLHLQFH